MTALYYNTVSWIVGSLYMVTGLLFEWTRIIHSKYDPEETAHVIQKFKVNYFQADPGVLVNLYESGVFSRYNFASLEKITTVGARIGPKLLQDILLYLPNCFIDNRYGMTEVGKISSTNSKCKALNSLGHLAAGIELRIVDLVSGKDRGFNEVGEIRLKSDNVMLGYYNETEKTGNAFDNEGWLRTGDLGYYDNTGELFFVDRVKELIRLTDHLEISPSTIENILLSHPAVAEVIVIAVCSCAGVERPLAFVRKTPNASETEKELAEYCYNIEKSFNLKDCIKFIDSFPLTYVGKIDKKALNKMSLI